MPHFMDLRHLTFANSDPAGMSKGETFVWVDGAIATVQSPIIRPAFEICARRAADLNVVD